MSLTHVSQCNSTKLPADLHLFPFQPDLVVSSEGVAEYKGCPFVINNAPVTSSLKDAQISWDLHFKTEGRGMDHLKFLDIVDAF